MHRAAPCRSLLATALLAAGCSGGTVMSATLDSASIQPDLSSPAPPADAAVTIDAAPGADAAMPPADLSLADATSAPVMDLAIPPDLVSPYLAATIHGIDTDPGNGPLGNARLVKLGRVVAVTDVDKYVNAANQQCRYQIWVQDPACVTPPCGMVIKAIGPMAPNPNSTGKDCPAARISGTLLANVGRGDNFELTGKLQFEVDAVAPMTVVEHQLFLDTITPLANNATITPTVLSDTTQYSQLVTHSGNLWNKYEGMSVTLAPAKGSLQVAALTSGGFRTIPGNTDWGNTFDGDYIPNGVMVFPTQGSAWKSIAGVVSCRHGGEINPVRTKDFVP